MSSDEKYFELRLRIDSNLRRRIQEAADTEGNSLASFVRSAVVKELKRREREDQV